MGKKYGQGRTSDEIRRVHPVLWDGGGGWRPPRPRKVFRASVSESAGGADAITSTITPPTLAATVGAVPASISIVPWTRDDVTDWSHSTLAYEQASQTTGQAAPD